MERKGVSVTWSHQRRKECSRGIETYHRPRNVERVEDALSGTRRPVDVRLHCSMTYFRGVSDERTSQSPWMPSAHG